MIIPAPQKLPVRIDWRTDKNAQNGGVVDLDTMQPISGPDGFCCFVDEATGEWKRYVCCDGKPVRGPDGMLLVESGVGRVKFFPFQGTLDQFKAFLRSYIREQETPS
jgi:hypothetical protein